MIVRAELPHQFHGSCCPLSKVSLHQPQWESTRGYAAAAQGARQGTPVGSTEKNSPSRNMTQPSTSVPLLPVPPAVPSPASFSSPRTSSFPLPLPLYRSNPQYGISRISAPFHDKLVPAGSARMPSTTVKQVILGQSQSEVIGNPSTLGEIESTPVPSRMRFSEAKTKCNRFERRAAA